MIPTSPGPESSALGTQHPALSTRPDRALALLTVVLMASWMEGLWTWLLAATIAEIDGQTAPALAFLGLVIFLGWLTSRALSLTTSDVREEQNSLPHGAFRIPRSALRIPERGAMLVAGGLLVAVGSGTVHAGLSQPFQWAVGHPIPDYRASGAGLALLVGYLWARGLTLASRVNRSHVVNQIGTTTFMLVVILLFLPLTTTVAQLGTQIVVGCFILSAACLLLVQLAENESYRLSKAQWMGLGVAATATIAGTGAALSGVLSTGFLGVGLRPLGQVLLPINNAILRVVSYVAEAATLFLIWLRYVAGGDPDAIQRAQQDADQAQIHLKPEGPYGPPEYFTTLAFLLVAALTIFWFSHLFARLAHAVQRRIGSTLLESHISEIGGAPGMGSLFSSLFHRPGASILGPLSSSRAGQIRRHYRAFQSLMARASFPRAEWQTPREYQSHLGQHLPSAEEPLATLTDAYNRARYGPPEAPLPEPDTVSSAVRAVRDTLRDSH